MNGVAWLDQIRSESAPGLSSIDLIFKPGTDPLKARQVVQERMTQAHALPNDDPANHVDLTEHDRRNRMHLCPRSEIPALPLPDLTRWASLVTLTTV